MSLCLPVRCLALLTALAALVPQAQAVGLPMAAHLAVYDMRLKSASEKSGITDVTGRMVVAVEGSDCDGWTVNFRSVDQFVTKDGDAPRLIDTQSSSWESGNGLKLRYSQRQLIDNKLDSEDRVTARRDGTAPGEGELVSGGRKTFHLPPDVIFPIAHQKRLMAAAARGDHRDKSRVYDGSEGEKFYSAITFIGDPQPPRTLAGVQGPDALSLSRLSYWPVTISYYDMSADSLAVGTPSHQVIMDMYGNGAARSVILDYGDFAVEGHMTRFQLLKTKACN